MTHTRPSILSIAGFDPTGGAGISTDAAVFRTLGFHPLTVLTSVAAQGGGSFAEVIPLPQSFIARELEIIAAEFQPHAVKIGMLYSGDAAEAAADYLDRHAFPIVLDPLIRSTSGGELILADAIPTIEARLIPQCTLVTPNLPEAEFFLGRQLTSLEMAKGAALQLHEKWHCGVLLKGGHLDGNPVDVLALDGGLTEFPHSRIDHQLNVRGTGCALSAAIAAGLADGKPLVKAIKSAVDFVSNALRYSYKSSRIDSIGFLDLEH